MSAVHQVIARLLTDHAFLVKVQTEGEAVLRSYPLTDDELAAMAELKLEQWDIGTIVIPPITPDVTVGVFRR